LRGRPPRGDKVIFRSFITERDRPRATQLKSARSEATRVDRILTGFSALDRVLDGGLPRGLITELSGAPLGQDHVRPMHGGAPAAEQPAAAWIDAEQVFDSAKRRSWEPDSNG
jgi:RecA/RadA recombinase